MNPEEAERVRAIFELFSKLRSVEATLAELEQRDWRTKSWITAKDKPYGGASFTTASLTGLLTNELYTGSVFLTPARSVRWAFASGAVR